MPTHLRAADIAGQLRSYLDTVQRQLEAIPTLETFGRHLDTVSRSYWPGLFHCYAIPGLPRTNNEVESHFRDASPSVADHRPAGANAADAATRGRLGTPAPSNRGEVTEVFRQTPSEDLAQERQRFAEHRQRVPLAEPFLKQTQAQFDQLRQQWSALQAIGTG